MSRKPLAGILLLCLWFGASPNAWAQRVPGRCADMLPSNAHYVKVQSVYMGNQLWPFIAVLPTDYDAPENKDRRYPVIYLFHGSTDDECIGPDRGMIEQVKAASAGLPPFIYVYLNGGDVCQYIDDVCPGLKPESYITQELVPYIDANYRTIANRSGRALDGFSMGGGGVALYGYLHSDMFCSFVAYAGHGAPPELAANKDKILANKLKTRFVVGDGDDGARIVEVRDHSAAVKALGVPSEFELVLGIGHDLPELYQAVGAKGLKLHFDCFAEGGGVVGGGGGAGGNVNSPSAGGTSGGGATGSALTGGQSGSGGNVSSTSGASGGSLPMGGALGGGGPKAASTGGSASMAVSASVQDPAGPQDKTGCACSTASPAVGGSRTSWLACAVLLLVPWARRFSRLL